MNILSNAVQKARGFEPRSSLKMSNYSRRKHTTNLKIFALSSSDLTFVQLSQYLKIGSNSCCSIVLLLPDEHISVQHSYHVFIAQKFFLLSVQRRPITDILTMLNFKFTVTCNSRASVYSECVKQISQILKQSHYSKKKY